MQLTTKPNSIDHKPTDKQSQMVGKLALAAASLLGTTVHAQTKLQDWNIAASGLFYSETDRVSAAEFILTGNNDFSDTSNFSFKLVLDTLTGSSANGAIAQNTPQTFSRPSGNGQYGINPNTTPLDDTFHDTRAQVNVNWTDAINESLRYTVGSNISKEYDYRSVSVNGELAKDFNQKNSTLSAGLSFGSDQYSPEGNIPVPFASMVVNNGQFANSSEYRTAFNATRSGSSDTVTTSELLLGWTQVINRRMLMQFNYGYAKSSGYLNDPFKILSVVDSNGTSQDYVFEGRPDSKTQNSFFGLAKYHFDSSVLDFSYRHISNDWDIKSNTFDTHWHIFASHGSFWEPHIRYYQQDAANFYSPFLVDGEPMPEFASADYRVGKMDAFTVGLKYGFQLSHGSRAEVRIEYYKQTPKAANQPQGIANLGSLDLYPSVNAIILQASYYF